ncbi:MAG: twin transmembrane helix small protein [Alphaproteobacteria bacterium]
MTAVLPYLIGAALLATLGVLFAGVIVMARGGELNRKYGNKLMRLRVAVQATAVVLFVLFMLTVR